MDKAWQRIAAVVMGLSLAACGGSGGGQSSVTYSGVTTQAEVTSGNAVTLATTAYQGGNSGGALALVGVVAEPAGPRGGAARAVTLSRVLKNAVTAARFSPAGSPQATVGATVSVSDSLPDGNCGGSASFSGSADEVTGEFHATFNFSGWCNDGVTVSGRVTASGAFDVNAEELLDLEFSFAVLTVSDGIDTFRGSGTISATFGTSEILTIDMNFESGDGTVYRASDLALAVSPTTGGESVTVIGRVYHPVHGYVEVTTPQALVVLTGDTFPSSGELVVTGSGGSKARLTPLSATQFQIEVDADGDDSYETTLGPLTWEST
jgi:hypothetical protein